jgi:hypothetical protein
MKPVRFKFYHNIFLLIISLFLMDQRSLFGMWFHEWAGLIVCLFYILHLLLNWSWIKEVTTKLFGKINTKVRVNYLMDLLLFIG